MSRRHRTAEARIAREAERAHGLPPSEALALSEAIVRFRGVVGAWDFVRHGDTQEVTERAYYAVVAPEQPYPASGPLG